jgi:hypothetical protein
VGKLGVDFLRRKSTPLPPDLALLIIRREQTHRKWKKVESKTPAGSRTTLPGCRGF